MGGCHRARSERAIQVTMVASGELASLRRKLVVASGKAPTEGNSAAMKGRRIHMPPGLDQALAPLNHCRDALVRLVDAAVKATAVMEAKPTAALPELAAELLAVLDSEVASDRPRDPPPRKGVVTNGMEDDGCVAGHCRVRVVPTGHHNATGAVPLSDICAGDRVICPSGNSVEVEAVLVTPCVSGVASLVVASDELQITPWHPVRSVIDDNPTSRWEFPRDRNGTVEVQCNEVITLLLDEAAHGDDAAFMVGSTAVAALGHGNTHDHVAAHAFWGTEKVRKVLRQALRTHSDEHGGRGTGRVLLEGVERDALTNSVVGISVAVERGRDRTAA